MTLQEKIEILEGVKNHPNKEKLVFKIDDEWISYLDLKNELYNYILKDPTNEFLYRGSQDREVLLPPIEKRHKANWINQGCYDLYTEELTLNETLEKYREILSDEKLRS